MGRVVPHLPDVREDGKIRVRCAGCGVTLAYATPDPIRRGAECEIKCWKCNGMNYLLSSEGADTA